MKRWIVALLIACGAPCAAEAHLVTTGFGSYYDGMAHLALSPADWLLVIALGLLAGLRGAACGRAILLSLPAGWLVGGVAGTAWPAGGEATTVMVLSFGLTGALVALDLKLPRALIVCVACGFGALHGYFSAASMAGAPGPWLALAGAVSLVFIASTLLPALVVSMRPAWTRIAVRVAGSWIAATGLLMLGWVWRQASHLP